ncbi:MEKHLA domain-containing protein [Rhizobium grahamii]|uniref:MEKHLA domain-containing protein n=1 Tax=Rhizobium grahamii TaxID=1120045 RepID=A0A370KK97_9HYPH|nr:MEKHLA domain-containing protein [Rhizobium grahamii]RDJ07859.1 hypothetical protein B5K06_21195 [Rhizobium grahamii]
MVQATFVSVRRTLPRVPEPTTAAANGLKASSSRSTTEPDPRFIYANVAAQKRFEYGWDEFIGMPSRLSAQAPDRAERQLLLEAVERQGFIADYRGLRVKKSGKRFWMEHGVVWQLVDGSGERHGQAAAFSSWTDL